MKISSRGGAETQNEEEEKIGSRNDATARRKKKEVFARRPFTHSIDKMLLPESMSFLCKLFANTTICALSG